MLYVFLLLLHIVEVLCGDAIKLETLFNSRPYEGVLVGFHENMEYNFIGDISSGTAKHMCTLLGYGHVGFSTPTLPGTMLGLFKEHVACKGSETSVSECNGVFGQCREPVLYHPLGPPRCLTYEKRALLCSDYILQGLRLGPDGILLMQINSRHWAVYEDEFSPQTAEAACKIMGHKGFKTFRTELSGPKDVEVLGSLVCFNNAARLEDCHLRHLFSRRPYDLSSVCDVCVKHVVLTCHNGTHSDFGPAFVG